MTIDDALQICRQHMTDIKDGIPLQGWQSLPMIEQAWEMLLVFAENENMDDRGMNEKMKPHELRVVDEKNELDDKKDKLQAFFGSETFMTLSETDKCMLHCQYQIMKSYSCILAERIRRFAKD